MMPGKVLLRGDILFPDGTEKGSISIVNGNIAHVSLGEIESPEDGVPLVEGLIVPGLVNMHTHLGDHDARGDLPVTLQEAFFPGGVKQRFLDGLDRSSLVSSIRAGLEEALPGVDILMDFREGGIEGMKALREALTGFPGRVLGFGRPAQGDDLPTLLGISQGLGMPSLESCSKVVRDEARSSGVPFALHASELYREDICRILDLDPDLLVHMVSGTTEDWRALADEHVPVVICPRAYIAFGLKHDILGMMEQGLALGLGTDNSMTMRQDMFREMECAWSLLHRGGLSGTESSKRVLDIATGRTLSATRLKGMVEGLGTWGSREWLRPGSYASVRVLRTPRKGSISDPWSYVVRFSGQDLVLW